MYSFVGPDLGKPDHVNLIYVQPLVWSDGISKAMLFAGADTHSGTASIPELTPPAHRHVVCSLFWSA